METFSWTTRFPMGREALFAWHERVGAFERLMPPWERVRIVDSGKGLMEGSRVVLEMNLGPWTQSWILEHGEYKRGFLFSDHLVKGLFAEWSHRHRFRDAENGMSELEDAIEYVPIHPWVGLCAGRFIRARIERGFRYRHEILLQDCARYGAEPKEPLKILVTGGTGFIGRVLIPLLKTQGHAVYVLSRKAGDGRIVWNPARGELDGDTLEGFDAVVHLAGEGIMGRWTEAKKQRIYESRVGGTRLLCEALARLKNKPRVLVSVSGVSACRDDGFLSQVGHAWEAAADPARKAGIRVVHPRVSVVLSPAGGALKTMLLPFRLGLGGRAGRGDQRMSWVAIDDLVDILYASIIDDRFEGPCVVSAPEVVDNRAFTKALACRLNRPACLPVPAKVLETVLGDVARDTVLADVDEPPKKLIELGHRFRYPKLAQALDHLLP